MTLMLLLALSGWLGQGRTPAATREAFSREITIERGSEVVVVLRAGCAGCNWGEAGREAATLSVSVDGVYSQHVVLVRGEAISEYPIVLGSLAAGRHRLTIERDATLTSAR